MTTDSLTNTAQILGAFAAITIAIGVLHRAGLGIYRAARRIEDTFDLVNHELRPNSGSSLHDAINRIDKRVEVLEGLDRRDVDRRDTAASDG